MRQQKNSKTGTKTKESMAKKKAAFLKVLDGSLGHITQACEAVSICRATYYRWINSDAKFKAKVDEIAESAIDYAESKLMETIKEKNVPSIIFYLKTKGKKRGYIETVEHDATLQGKLSVIGDQRLSEIVSNARDINERIKEKE